MMQLNNKVTFNPLLNTDSYKVGMWKQYPPGTEYIFSYVEARGGPTDKIVVDGYMGYLKRYLRQRITQQDIDYAAEFYAEHFNDDTIFNREGFELIVNEFDGYLPVKVQAVEEGTVVNVSNVIATITNTDPRFYWLPAFIETSFLRSIWYGTTVATLSWNIKQLLNEFAMKTTGSTDSVIFKLVDFGARGVSSFESAEIGGSSNMVNFAVTDNPSAVQYIREIYETDIMAGITVGGAAEHSTITSWGRDYEKEAYLNMVEKFAKPGAIVAVVSDSYNILDAVENIWGSDEVKQKVIDSGATIVIRPDSGDPATMVGQVLDILADKYGYVVNEYGYKDINTVKVIQGDGIKYESIQEIINVMLEKKYSINNITFGQGGAMLQEMSRDTYKFAMKASAARVNGEWRDVFKDPITDTGKRSKRGLIDLVRTFDGRLVTDAYGAGTSVLNTVFENGKVMNEISFEKVRENSTNLQTVA